MQKINGQSIVNDPFLEVLSRIDAPPQELYIKGVLPKKRIPTVAIVGTRRPSPYGEEVTRTLAKNLAGQGIAIISGLAFGVDAIAHQAAIDAHGTTIAIQASGLHAIAPRSNKVLGEAIIKKGGAIISEYPLGHEAQRYHFLARNRLISGLADAVIVTEATEKSGTLSTVGHALTQNKEVFAVPGPITSPTSIGSNTLIQQGAHPVLRAQDVLDIIAPQLVPRPTQLPFGDTPLEDMLIKLIASGVQEGSELQRATGVSSQEFLQTMTMMELKETVTSRGGIWTLL